MRVAALAILAAVLAMALGAGRPVEAAETIVLERGQSVRTLAGHLEVLRDPTHSLTLNDVAFGAAAEAFRPVPGFLNLGFIGDAVWVRFSVRRASGAPEGWLLDLGPPFLDELQIFAPRTAAPRGTADFDRLVVGARRPVPAELTGSRSFVLPVDLVAEESRTYYLRIATDSSTVLNGQFATPAAFASQASGIALFFGGYYGVAAVIILINLINWLWLRDTLYLLYMLYVGTLLSMQLGGGGTLAQVWPEGSHWVAVYLTRLGICSSVALAGVFSSRLLHLRTTMPWTHRFVMACSLVGVVGAVVALFGGYRFVGGVVHGTVIPMTLMLVYAGTVLARRGPGPARLFLLSFAVTIIGASLSILRTLGVLPSVPLTEYSYMVGNLIHMVLLNVALAKRIKTAEEDKRVAQNAALEASRGAERRAVELADERTRELAAAKESLEQALAAERQAVRDQIQFIDMISHEYRTPVAVMRTSLDTLDMGAAAVPGVAKPVARMRRAVDRLVEIIEVGLKRDKLDPERFRLHAEPLDLGTLVAAAVEEARTGHPDRTVEVDAPAGLRVAGDPPLLKTAILNLVTNACKYSPPDTAVHVVVSGPPGVAEIRVRDQGAGIPAAERAHVFEKFYRGAAHQTISGAGLGLHLVQTIAHLHGGDARLEERTGPGCTFLLTLPSLGDGARQASLQSAASTAAGA